MTVTLTTFESNLQTKLNNTTGTTDGQEFLLLSKSVEALNPSITVQAVQTEGTTQVSNVNTAGTTQVAAVNSAGTTQVAAVQAAGSGYAALTGATFSGAIDMGSNNITTTGKMLFANVYNTPADLPNAATYHGLFAHTHSNGRAVFSHNSNWYNLLHEDTSGNVNLGGDLTVTGSLIVNGTTTTINSTTLDVDDLNITVASGAANAAAASGAGITVDGASANITYTASTDTWDFNKAITGTYTNFNPTVNTANVTSSQTIDMTKPMHHFDMTGATAFSGVSIAAGRTSMMLLDTTATPHTPTWGSDIKWPGATEPTWTDSRYWIISFTCVDSSVMLATAQGYTI